MENKQSNLISIGEKIINFGKYKVLTLRSPGGSKIIDFLYTHKSFLNGFALALGVLTILSSCLFIIEYKHYAAIVDEHLSGQGLQYRAGIYASPVHIKVKKPISKDELKERLLRANYIEGTEQNELAIGNFIVNENSIEIHTSESVQSQRIPEIVPYPFGSC